jgi:hypothetical protein
MDVAKESQDSDNETEQMPSMNNVYIMPASEELSYLLPVPEGKEKMVRYAVCFCSQLSSTLFALCAEVEHVLCCTVDVLITSIYGNLNNTAILPVTQLIDVTISAY